MAEKFGERIRKIRTLRNLGLRETASKVDISAAYLSRIETNEESTPPAEDVIMKLARILDDDVDELMRLAGRIPTDVREYINKPGMPAFLRTAREKKYTSEQLLEMLEREKKGKR